MAAIKPQKSIQLIFLVVPLTNLFDFAGASQVFHEAREQGMDLELKFCSFSSNLRTAADMPLGKLTAFSAIKPRKGDYVFIVSAHIDHMLALHFKPGHPLLQWLNTAYANGANICSFCNGAFILGQTGLLDGRKCTTHWKRTTDLKNRFPLAEVQDNVIFVEDDRIFTSAGATSGVDVALHILGKLKDDYFACKISRELVIYTRRSGSDAQQRVLLSYRNHMHAGIHRVQEWLQQNLHKKVNIPELAEIALMSERNFTRVFKKETQLTVNDYITLLRREKINELLKNPDMSRIQIARRCGLSSERHVNRILKLN
jgi:transcriptional regulator GlxA family with amidase domain